MWKKTGKTGRNVLGLSAVSVLTWHIGPAASWLPGVRGTLLPGLAGRGDPGHVALTFDDGPDPQSTPHFLAKLRELDARATFFVLGSELARHPEVGREIVAQGHELAVHGWRHEYPWHPAPLRDVRELRRASTLVRRVGGSRPLWYRPPYGILTGGRWTACRRVGLRPVLWSAWGRDWTADADGESVLARLEEGLSGGATVLLHDSDHTSQPGSWRAGLAALPALVERCRTAGWRVGPLNEHKLPAPGR